MENRLVVGIEIGGTKLQVGLGRGDGRIVGLERRTVVPDSGGAGIRAQIVESFATLLRRAGTAAESIGAVGIGFGGPVDVDRGLPCYFGRCGNECGC